MPCTSSGRSNATRWGVERIETVYLGGGTPSLLGEERLERLLEPLEPLLTPKAEVTVETNPEDVTPGYAAWAAARGLRLSLGVQSFDRRLRENLGRRTLADPAAAFATLRRAGVADLGVDLIFGIPGQAIVDVARELEVVAALRPDHVSWYELTVGEGTALAARLETRRCRAVWGGTHPTPPGDDAQAEMYRRIVAGLERVGYHWYEVSNFARPGSRCRHNGAYWRGRDFLGLGPGAVSTVGDTRWRNDAGVDAVRRRCRYGAGSKVRDEPARSRRLADRAPRRPDACPRAAAPRRPHGGAGAARRDRRRRSTGRRSSRSPTLASSPFAVVHSG